MASLQHKQLPVGRLLKLCMLPLQIARRLLCRSSLRGQGLAPLRVLLGLNLRAANGVLAELALRRSSHVVTFHNVILLGVGSSGRCIPLPLPRDDGMPGGKGTGASPKRSGRGSLVAHRHAMLHADPKPLPQIPTKSAAP